MPSVVLVNPIEPGNIGAVARVMANFGFSDLVLVDPRADHVSDDAITRAKHAKNVLESARVISETELERFDLLIATTARLGSDYNIVRTPLSLREAAQEAAGAQGAGIVFGPEDRGLTNEQLRACDLLVTIPSSEEYPSLNLSHACALVCYEFSGMQRQDFVPPPREEKERFLNAMHEVIERLGFPTYDKRETQYKLWERLISKSFLTRRELYVLFGFLKRLRGKLDQRFLK